MTWRNLFRRRARPAPERPPINEDWRVGDLAVCVEDNWSPGVVGPRAGEISRVVDVYPGLCARTGMPGWGLRFAGYHEGFGAICFRKVQPDAEPAEASFAEFLTRMLPKRAPATPAREDAHHGQ